MQDTIKKQVLDILQEINPYEDVDENTNLIEDGFLDSLTLVILVNELERIYHVKIPEKRMKPEMFETISQVSGLINELLDR